MLVRSVRLRPRPDRTILAATSGLTGPRAVRGPARHPACLRRRDCRGCAMPSPVRPRPRRDLVGKVAASHATSRPRCCAGRGRGALRLRSRGLAFSCPPVSQPPRPRRAALTVCFGGARVKRRSPLLLSRCAARADRRTQAFESALASQPTRVGGWALLVRRRLLSLGLASSAAGVGVPGARRRCPTCLATVVGAL